MILFGKITSLETKEDNLPTVVLKDVNRNYHIFLKHSQLQMLSYCLIFYKLVIMNSKYLAYVVVLKSLGKRLFNHYHYGPTGGHVGDYVTLYRMINRF